MPLTIDVFENRGFEYHCGIGFSVFSKQSGQELGRGGRYFAGIEGEQSEPAVGITLFLEDILPVLKKTDEKMRIFVPFDVSFKETADLRAKGYVTVCGLKEGGREEAQRQKCGCIYTGGQIVPL